MDADILALAQNGNEDAFRRLVDPHLPKLYKIAAMVLLDSSLAKDTVQEALIRAHLNLRRFRGSSLGPWLRCLVINEARRLYRRNQKQSLMFAELSDSVVSDYISPEDAVTMIETRACLVATLSRLSPKHRIVLVLRYFDELPEAEIAQVIGVRIGTVKSRLHNARIQLRKKLEAEDSTIGHWHGQERSTQDA